MNGLVCEFWREIGQVSVRVQTGLVRWRDLLLLQLQGQSDSNIKRQTYRNLN